MIKTKNNKLLNQKGFTATELLISVVIGLLILLIVSTVFILNSRVIRKSNTKAELTQNVRITNDLMAREIRQANDIVTVLPVDDSDPDLVTHELQFEDGHNTNQIQYIRYYLNGTDLMRQINVYYFDSDPDTYVHWDDVDAFGAPESAILEDKLIGENFTTINYFGQNDVTVQLELEKSNERVLIETIINPRNI